MNEHTGGAARKGGNRRSYILTLCVAGLLINLAGSKLALALDMPLFLDIIGTALAAALGGVVPGMVVGFFTNLINGVSDYTTAYYGSLNVLIAIASAGFARKGYYRKPWKLPLIVLVFALIGGGLGSVLTWLLYGFDFGTGISAPLAHRIFAMGRLNEFWSQFAADMLIDVADKAITVAVVAVVLNQMPARLRAYFQFNGWQQAPLAEQDERRGGRFATRGASLRAKIVVLVMAVMLVLALVVTAISFIHFRTASIEKQLEQAGGVARVAARSIDGGRVDEFLRLGEDAEGYSEIRRRLDDLADSSESLSAVGVYSIAEDGCRAVFASGTQDAPGARLPLTEAMQECLPALLAGEEVEPVRTGEGDDWRYTVFLPVYDGDGACRCYVAAEADMGETTAGSYQFLARVVSLFFGFFVLILAGAIWLAEYSIILPINAMATTAGRSAYDSAPAREDTVESIRQLDIHTGDEIENLYHSVVKTTEDMVETVESVEHQNEVINKLQNGLIMVLADMVESRDKCTGDHVRKTSAYAGIILRQLKKEGVYADQLTETFIQDVTNSAPLHDVGKIMVSDAILNKPGRLTDEEFELMKKHTTAGAEIISRAIDMVSEQDSGYLKEARNLAEFHHEKWAGGGYPFGLKGEEIPLSARVMAVADVFDALVSKRSYKEGFPFEKAVAIIRQDSGTHFDPRIVDAFLRAQDDVKRVMGGAVEQ